MRVKQSKIRMRAFLSIEIRLHHLIGERFVNTRAAVLFIERGIPTCSNRHLLNAN